MKARMIKKEEPEKDTSIKPNFLNGFMSGNYTVEDDSFAGINSAAKKQGDISSSETKIKGETYLNCISRHKDSFVNNKEFLNSKPFIRYCTRFKKHLDECIKIVHSPLKFYIDSVDFQIFMKNLLLSYYISLYDKTHGVKTLDEIDVSISLGLAKAVSPWNIEKDFHSDYVDYNNVHMNTILDLIFDFLSGKKPLSLCSHSKIMFDGLCDKVMREVVAEYIAVSATLEKSLNRENFINLISPESLSEETLFVISNQIYDRLVSEIDNMVYDKLLTLDLDEFFTQLHDSKVDCSRKCVRSSYLEKKENFGERAKQYEMQMRESENKCLKYEQEIKKQDEEILRLNNSLDKIKSENYKAEQGKTSALNAEIKALKAELCREKEKNAKLEEFIRLLQTEDESDEKKNDSEDIEKMAEPFRNARIVFVRNNRSTHYLIMQQLEQFFPNAKFTNGTDKTIDRHKTDLVVILTKYVEHGTYWGTRDAARSAGVEYIHAEGSSLKRIVKFISEIIEKRQTETRVCE